MVHDTREIVFSLTCHSGMFPFRTITGQALAGIHYVFIRFPIETFGNDKIEILIVH
jgi:hypothetical protein